MTFQGVYEARLRRILHVAAISLPHANGYTLRLRSILATQKAAGCEVAVITSPFYPGRLSPSLVDVIDGIEHVRVRHPSEVADGGRLVPWLRRMRTPRHRGAPLRLLGSLAAVIEERLLSARLERGIVEVARRHDSQLIHVHSPYRIALPAIAAARRLALPVVYEVRGMWEDTAVTDGLMRQGGFGYRYIRRQESKAMRGADVVVTLCEQLAAEVRSRGVAEDQVFVAPNGADLDRLDAAKLRTPSQTLSEAFRRLAGCPVIGYVGSLRPLEGVETLLRALRKLRSTGRDVRGLVVGGGQGLEPLRRLAREFGLDGAVVFTGQVPADEVGSYYDRIDVFVVSRPSSRVTDMVTPIKPLEAMGRGKAVVMSDLPALRELGESADAAEYHRREDPDDLARHCESLLDDDSRRAALGARARRFVETERTWGRTLGVLPAAYVAASERAEVRKA